MNNNPIGVYDSGFGGLSVWRELHRALPNESLLYLGDGKNCPYGSKSVEQIRELAENAVRELIDRGAKLVVVACNTATAAAIAHLRSIFPDMPIVGLEPAIKPACLESKSRKVGVLATERSLKGEKFLTTLAKYGEGVEVIKSVGEGFVEAVEANKEDDPQTKETVRKVVEPMIEQGVDIIVLGCTHYPFLADTIKKVAAAHGADGNSFHLIDPAPAVARHLLDIMTNEDIIKREGFSISLHASGDDSLLRNMASSL